jgi:hypothetical protein
MPKILTPLTKLPPRDTLGPDARDLDAAALLQATHMARYALVEPVRDGGCEPGRDLLST